MSQGTYRNIDIPAGRACTNPKAVPADPWPHPVGSFTDAGQDYGGRMGCCAAMQIRTAA
jgi:hypothetical protein